MTPEWAAVFGATFAARYEQERRFIGSDPLECIPSAVEEAAAVADEAIAELRRLRAPEPQTLAGRLKAAGDDPDSYEPEAQAPEPQAETITAAAIQRTTTGKSHAECFHEAAKLPNYVQGFITSTGRFVDRKEALKIATESGQFKGPKRYRPLDMLMSEDLWGPQPEAQQPAAEPKADHAFETHVFIRCPGPAKAWNMPCCGEDSCHRVMSDMSRCGRPRSEHPEGGGHG